MVDGFRLDNSIHNDNYNIIWWSKHTVSCISFPIQDIDLEYDFVVHILAYRNNWTTLSQNYSYSFVVCISDSLLIYFFLCQMLPLFDTINDKLIKKKIFDWRIQISSVWSAKLRYSWSNCRFILHSPLHILLFYSNSKWWMNAIIQ